MGFDSILNGGVTQFVLGEGICLCRGHPPDPLQLRTVLSHKGGIVGWDWLLN